MSQRPRASLSDRNRAAIERDSTEPEAPQQADEGRPTTEEAKTIHEDSARRPATQPTTGSHSPEAIKPATTRAKSPKTTDTVRLGIYITPEEFDSAKSAYLADWQHGGQADTFTRWIGEVMDAHAARGAAERARLARPTGRADTRTGASRSFTVPADTIERMRRAINEDQDADRWPSDSAWCSDAIAAAVHAARERAGGALPAPPPRLPNRLRR